MPSSFASEATAALQRAGFAPPHPDEACVIQFDTTPWWPLFHEAVELLPEHETARAQRFRHIQDRNTYALAHAFWRLALALTLDCALDEVTLSRGAHGQPLLHGTPFATSLSHSGSQVAIAIARTSTVGVDIEQSPPRPSLSELIELLCTPAEAQALQTLPPSDRTEALLLLWTRKEALLKAFGIGLRVAPSSIDAPLGIAIDPPIAASGAPACRIHALELPVTLAGALAAPSAITHVQLHTLPSTRATHLTA
jgi:4'-phosphopantetheinyl transferase